MVSELHRRIRHAAQHGSDLEYIERTIIEDAPLSEEEKSALWLYAHVHTERPFGQGVPVLSAS